MVHKKFSNSVCYWEEKLGGQGMGWERNSCLMTPVMYLLKYCTKCTY